MCHVGLHPRLGMAIVSGPVLSCYMFVCSCWRSHTNRQAASCSNSTGTAASMRSHREAAEEEGGVQAAGSSQRQQQRGAAAGKGHQRQEGHQLGGLQSLPSSCQQ